MQHRGLPAVMEGRALAVVHVMARVGLSGPPGDSAGARGQDPGEAGAGASVASKPQGPIRLITAPRECVPGSL